MATSNSGKLSKQEPPGRDDRLKAALKANMAKRKAQAKARQAQDDGPDDKDKS